MIPFIVAIIIFLIIIGILAFRLAMILDLPIIFLVFVLCMIILGFTEIKNIVKSKHPVTPTITVNCENNKCDTTYTYKEK